MSQIERTYITGYSCDKRDCPATIEGPEEPYWLGRKKYWQAALDAGWSAWYGSRTRRVYCPDHRPSRGAQMQKDEKP